MRNTVNNIKTSFFQFFPDYLKYRRSLTEMKYDNEHVENYLCREFQLTQYEKNEIKDKWASIIPIPLSRGYKFFVGLKNLDKFNSDYLPSSYYMPFVVHSLNIESSRSRINHKSLLQILFNNILQPVTLIRSYGGLLMNGDYNKISLPEAVDVINKSTTKIILKPSTDSCQGLGVELFDDFNKDVLCQRILSGNVKNGSDFIIQEFVDQCDELNALNPTSLNCFRITTLNLNNQVSICSPVLKCGPTGAFVDNLGSGKRGIMIGVKNDGSLKGIGFYGNGEKAYSHNNVTFDGYNVPYFNKILECAKNLHEDFEGCRIIGWDIALNNNYEPVLIEANVGSPSISVEQMCSGPIFGDRTEEVIRYITDSQGVVRGVNAMALIMIGDYDEDVLMLMYDDVVMARKSELADDNFTTI